MENEGIDKPVFLHPRVRQERGILIMVLISAKPDYPERMRLAQGIPDCGQWQTLHLDVQDFPAGKIT